MAGDHPIATLVNWSDHPETLGGGNTLITADFPHWLCQYVENHDGGTAVFFQGSIGGLLSTLGDDVALQDPETGRVAKDGTWRKAELFGVTVGELATRALKNGQDAPVDSLVIRQAVIFAPLDNDHFRAASALNIYKGRKRLYTDGRVDSSTAEKVFPGLGKLQCATGHDLETEVDYIQLLSHGQVLAEITTFRVRFIPSSSMAVSRATRGPTSRTRLLNPPYAPTCTAGINLSLGWPTTNWLHHSQGRVGQPGALAPE